VPREGLVGTQALMRPAGEGAEGGKTAEKGGEDPAGAAITIESFN